MWAWLVTGSGGTWGVARAWREAGGAGLGSDCERPGPELCSFPSANVSLLGEHREKVLLYGQLYRISVELELPESPVNRELGMFMVRLTCYGSGGKTLATASRS
ncbi:PREDICTED: seipin, partial [Pseudopodoces humilis]|uniref:seipin n=1 Tax=Pseudopodoces humilis TaxID=181119 RepID=UPI0006B81C5A